MPKREFASRRLKLAIILQTLQQGEFKHASGNASAVLYEAACTNGLDCSLNTFKPMLADLEEKGLIAREIRGKRCYEIVFVDSGDYVTDQPLTLETQQEELPIPTVESVSEESINYQTLAVSLLEGVVEILQRPAEFETNQQALYEAREQAVKWKKAFNDEQQETEYLRTKTRELTVELSQTKDNLRRVMADKGKAVSHETQKALDRVMRERPASK